MVFVVILMLRYDEDVSFSSVGNSPRYPHSVFCIFDKGTDGVFFPVGSCFAVSNKYLLSCQHFMNGRKANYYIALNAEKSKNGIVTFPNGCYEVTVVKFNSVMDYALLELKKEPFELVSIPISLMPVSADEDVKIIHFPVAFFLNGGGIIGPFANWMKTSLPTSHHLPCSGGGLFKGSSGSPYVLRNGSVVGLHIESVNDASIVDFEEDDNVDFRNSQQ